LCDIKSNNDKLMRCVTGKEVNLRMGKKLVYLSGVTLFALTVTFAGCGKKEEPAPPPPPPPAPAEPAPPAPDAAAPSGEKAAEPAKDGAMEKKEEGKTN
jgi:hypothetical protein